jgi:hypothetical protein
VSAEHDDATKLLLRHIVTDGVKPEDAVALTMADIGPDPTFGSRLVSQP